MKVLAQKFKTAQKNYNLSVKELKAQMQDQECQILEECDVRLSMLEESHEISKGQLLESTVNNILTKLV